MTEPTRSPPAIESGETANGPKQNAQPVLAPSRPAMTPAEEVSLAERAERFRKGAPFLVDRGAKERASTRTRSSAFVQVTGGAEEEARSPLKAAILGLVVVVALGAAGGMALVQWSDRTEHPSVATREPDASARTRPDGTSRPPLAYDLKRRSQDEIVGAWRKGQRAEDDMPGEPAGAARSEPTARIDQRHAVAPAQFEAPADPPSATPGTAPHVVDAAPPPSEGAGRRERTPDEPEQRRTDEQSIVTSSLERRQPATPSIEERRATPPPALAPPSHAGGPGERESGAHKDAATARAPVAIPSAPSDQSDARVITGRVEETPAWVLVARREREAKAAEAETAKVARVTADQAGTESMAPVRPPAPKARADGEAIWPRVVPLPVRNPRAPLAIAENGARGPDVVRRAKLLRASKAKARSKRPVDPVAEAIDDAVNFGVGFTRTGRQSP